MSIPAEQQEIAAFLQRLAAGPPVETHISAVFVGRITAWKMKKAVKLPFLDFTDLAERRRLLERELELNKPAAPEIYRDLAAIVRGPHGPLALMPEPGQRPALEWVLRMAPIPARDFLDTLTERGELTPDLQDALGDCAAVYHARLPPISGSDSPARLLSIAEGNVPSALAAGLPEPAVRAWIADIRTALTALKPWLEARDDAGFVRRGHGDLHLGNLCLWRGRPVPFDALEFDEALATTDIGYDMAFLAMDLDRRAGRAAANRVMNRYIARNGDAGLVRGLPVFLSIRAMVLAHVRAARGDPDMSSAYFQAALDYLRPDAPIVVAIGGLQATGKSTLARALAPDIGAAPGALLLRSDELRKRLFDVAPEQRLPAAAYTETVNAQVNAAIVEATKLRGVSRPRRRC